MTDIQIALEPQYQGAGKKGQKALIQNWFSSLREAPEAGRKVAYSFVTAAPFTLLRAFDVVDFVLPEVQSLQISVKGLASKFLSVAEEDMGFSTDVCGYMKIDAGLIHSGLEHPLGKVPPPDLVMCSTCCNTYIKWAELWARYYDVPLMLIDYPSRVEYDPSYWGGDTFKADRAFVLAQLKDLIDVLERLTGKTFDPDRLAEQEAEWNQVVDFWPQITAFNKHKPAIFNAFSDGLYYMGALQSTRGGGQSLPYLQEVRKELQERLDFGLFPVPDEQFRMGIHFAPCWANLKQWFGMFDKWKVAYAYGPYMNGIANFRYDILRPLESAAEEMLYTNQHGNVTPYMDFASLFSRSVGEYHLDGMVLQGLKSCRLISTPLLDYRKVLQQEGIPTLFLEGDIVDPRYFSQAQLKNRVDAFFEALRQKKYASRS